MLEEPGEVRFDIPVGDELDRERACFCKGEHFGLRFTSSKGHVPPHENDRAQQKQQPDRQERSDCTPESNQEEHI